MSKKRFKLKRKKSKKLFSRAARRVHPKNGMNPMRGGIRA